jgi:hypothetical protein
VDEQLSNAERCHEADQLVVLVEIILCPDIVFAAVRRAREVELGGEGDIGVVEWHKPDGKELGDVEVEN